MDWIDEGGDELLLKGTEFGQNVASLVEFVQDTGKPVDERVLAAHMLHEHFLVLNDKRSSESCIAVVSGSGPGGCVFRLEFGSIETLLSKVLDLLVEAERLQFIPAKLLYDLAMVPGMIPALHGLGGVEVALGVLRASQEPLLACACLALLASLTQEQVVTLQLCGTPRAASLMLRMFWRWHQELDALRSLLQIFEQAMHAPCHRTLLSAELPAVIDGAGSGSSKPPGPLRLDAVLQYSAERAGSHAEESWHVAGRWAARLAKDWSALARALHMH